MNPAEGNFCGVPFWASSLSFFELMSDEVPAVNPPLSPMEQSVVAKLTDTDLAIIDRAILANSFASWSKVAAVVAFTDRALSAQYPDLSYILYAQRLIRLAVQGRLESQGNLEFIRFSEVRIPA